ncbi:sugar nucleotide-binding protein [Leptolyngbya sp. FACHB-671]|uniref:family 1 glycosylhydrolase n=1 Tax=Leptolyngbya sp. FACHB-671 TaxID=2692812 RepID=UPI001688BCCA|nr:family 1 glycosylhydrolase [Leptolyngbya sp. FACHB-671]MBD2068214.1 sugar nucleotide-binding protein [Leptolyngbya sp. FACHB-671]
MNLEPLSLPPLEMWAGVECTVNRVGDEYFDQLERNGHATRLNDLDRFAALGIRAIRYPVLWERVAPNGLEKADWTWTDERLERLRELGICPIVGLVHHGSGPRDTSLIDPAFPERLAEFAHAVSDRYPWVTHYTPVNEPLTTARFSGLYGHWYPHGRDDRTFLRALLVQCRSVALSMQAVRQVNPDAQLVQTEDMGKTFSTPLLAYQAELENQRRWLSLDLLCGRINPDHPLWHYFCQVDIEAAELEWFLEHPCPPDIVGINYYLTSDRLLDEQLEKYPTHFHGGNGQHEYADVEAVRVCGEGVAGHYRLLRETWERYQLPVAVTEVHLCCTREEQLRWLKQAWEAAQQLRGEGADIRAITAWSLLGAYDWNSLVTRANNFYEPGVFDLRSPTPRATALATMVSHFSQGKTYEHPILETPGWWQRPERLFYPAVNCNFSSSTTSPARHDSLSPLVITGATGTLGQAFARICDIRGIPYRLLTRQEMNITDIQSVERSLDELRPWAVINTAGYVRVDDAEREPHLCQKINADGAAILAQACVERSVGLVTFSSDLVFDGTHTKPYLESHQVSPLNVYGHSKAVAEKWVLQTHPCSLVIRTSAFFGPWDRHNFLTILLQTLADGNPFVAANDAIVSPTYVPDLVNTTLDLLIDGECGLWHLANPGAIAWAELAQLTAKLAGMDVSRIEARPSHSLGWVAPRPVYSALGSERGTLLPELDQAIARYLRERQSV